MKKMHVSFFFLSSSTRLRFSFLIIICFFHLLFVLFCIASSSSLPLFTVMEITILSIHILHHLWIIPKLRWLIFGCGGVGGYFGARIAKVKGQSVSFMVRNEALTALREHGVRIQSICGDEAVPPGELGPTIDTQGLDTAERFQADVIMLGCKAWEAERCLQMCEPWCGPETVVLPLQNGVEGLSTIKNIVASWRKGHALAGCCNIVSAIKEPGFIRHWASNPPYITFGEFEGAPTPKTLRMKAIFDACSGMEGHLEDDALSGIWEKFCFICSTTGVQATSGPSATQDLIPKVPELEKMWRAAMREIIALARHYGIRYEDSWLEKRIEVLKNAPGATTSCSRDLWAGRPSELDDLLGSVERMGLKEGIPTPVISTRRRLWCLRLDEREASRPQSSRCTWKRCRKTRPCTKGCRRIVGIWRMSWDQHNLG